MHTQKKNPTFHPPIFITPSGIQDNKFVELYNSHDSRNFFQIF